MAYALLPHIRLTELNRAQRKHPTNMDAYDFVLRGMYRLYRLGEEDFTASRRAVPGGCRVRSALCDGTGHARQMVHSQYRRRALPRHPRRFAARRFAAPPWRSRTARPTRSRSPSMAIRKSFLFAEYDQAIDAFGRAIAANPNSAHRLGLQRSHLLLCRRRPRKQRSGQSVLSPCRRWSRSPISIGRH